MPDISEPKYDAFISYSHGVDHLLAAKLQQALQRFAKPLYRLRSLRIFRDETSLAVSHALPESITQALANSAHLILLASRSAAGSYWVDQEVRYWLSNKESGTLLIVLTDGEIVWSNTAGDFDWTRTNALPPSLKSTLAVEPKWLDVSALRPVGDISPRNPIVQHATASLFSAITGRPLEDVIGDDVREHRRNTLIFQLGAGAIVAALCGTLFFWWEAELANNRLVTLADLAATGAPAYVQRDLSRVENREKLVEEVIRSAVRIASRDMRNARVLWLDDNPENNSTEKEIIARRLERIGVAFEEVTSVQAAVGAIRSKSFHAVISNYGNKRCGRDNKAIAECLLEEVQALATRPPILVYSVGFTAEQADAMKCRGAVAQVDNPDTLTAWLIRALAERNGFAHSREIQNFCGETGPRRLGPQ